MSYTGKAYNSLLIKSIIILEKSLKKLIFAKNLLVCLIGL